MSLPCIIELGDGWMEDVYYQCPRCERRYETDLVCTVCKAATVRTTVTQLMLFDAEPTPRFTVLTGGQQKKSDR